MTGTAALTVVIPTYNRRERLGRVLAALDRQVVPPDSFDVVVVDDGSSDGTTEWLARQCYAFRLHPLRQANAGPAQARNAGVAAATGELLLFLDDDVVPLPELVSEHLRSHAAEPGPVVVMGPLSSLPRYAQPWIAWEQAKLERQYASMATGHFRPSFRQFWTGNASVARSHVVEAGAFNSAYLRAEDVELGYRLHLRGLGFRFNPRAGGLHHAERSLESWINAHQSYGRLEVEIFGNLSEAQLVDILAWNWGRLHPAVRQVVRTCLANPRGHDAAVAALRGWLVSPLATRIPRVSDKTCSVLANLLYWRASTRALGDERWTRIRREGDEIARTRVRHQR